MQTNNPTTTPTTGLTGSMLISSLLAEVAAYTDRSNCKKGMLRFAAKHSLDPDLFEVIGEAPAFRFVLKGAAGAPDADPMQTPAFLDRLQGRTREDIDAERRRLTAKHGSRAIKDPRSSLRSPKAGGATGLGMSPFDLKEVGAKSKADKAKKSRKTSKTSQRVASAKRADSAKADKPAKVAKPKGEAKGKGAAVIALIKARWTPMDDIVKATGWQKHTTRAFISRLNTVDKMGVETKREDGVTSYRIP